MTHPIAEHAGRFAEIERDFTKAVTAAVEALAGLGMSADEIGEWLTGGIQSDALVDVAWGERLCGRCGRAYGGVAHGPGLCGDA